MTFITKIEKSTLKFTWKHKRPGIDIVIMKKKSNYEGTTIPNFKIYTTIPNFKIYTQT
jgi:hypothetical protein